MDSVLLPRDLSTVFHCGFIRNEDNYARRDGKGRAACERQFQRVAFEMIIEGVPINSITRAIKISARDLFSVISAGVHFRPVSPRSVYIRQNFLITQITGQAEAS